MTAAIAAYRAGNAPHIVQVFEVGTATMMAAKGAVKPVYQLMADAGEKFDPEGLPAGGRRLLQHRRRQDAVDAVQQLDPGRSTGTRTRSRRPGSIPNKPPKTWPETFAAAKKLQGAAGGNCGFTSAWQSAGPSSRTSAPGTTCRSPPRQNGFGGPGHRARSSTARCRSRHIANLQRRRQKDKSFDYGGREQRARRPSSISGECAMIQTSSGCLRQRQEQRQVRVRRRRAAVLPRRARARRRTRSSAAPACG